MHWKLTVHVRNVVEPWFGYTLYMVQKFQQNCHSSQLFAGFFKCCNSSKTYFLLSCGHTHKISYRFCELKRRETKALTDYLENLPCSSSSENPGLHIEVGGIITYFITLLSSVSLLKYFAARHLPHKCTWMKVHLVSLLLLHYNNIYSKINIAYKK